MKSKGQKIDWARRSVLVKKAFGDKEGRKMLAEAMLAPIKKRLDPVANLRLMSNEHAFPSKRVLEKLLQNVLDRKKKIHPLDKVSMSNAEEAERILRLKLKSLD